MLDIYVCDDQEGIRNYIKEIIENVVLIKGYDAEVAVVTGQSKEVLKKIGRAGNNGVYFLDIDIGEEINGIELARTIRRLDPRGFIIFITSHSEMMKEVFRYKVEALDFIEKDNPQQMVYKIRESLKYVMEKQQIVTNKSEGYFTFKTSSKEFFIEYNKIIYFETTNKSHKIRVCSEDRQSEFYGKLGEVIESLDHNFCRCHQSTIVNMNKIQEINKCKREIIMTNGAICRGSVRGMKEIRRGLEEKNKR